jgi:hypothetical protein
MREQHSNDHPPALSVLTAIFKFQPPGFNGTVPLSELQLKILSDAVIPLFTHSLTEIFNRLGSFALIHRV